MQYVPCYPSDRTHSCLVVNPFWTCVPWQTNISEQDKTIWFVFRMNTYLVNPFPITHLADGTLKFFFLVDCGIIYDWRDNMIYCFG